MARKKKVVKRVRAPRFLLPLPPVDERLLLRDFQSLKPSQLLRLGVRDVARARKHGVQIDMSDWHALKNDESEMCAACMAGCVLHESLGKKKAIGLHGLSDKTVKQMYLIDAMRCGYESRLIESGVPRETVVYYHQAMMKSFRGRLEGAYADDIDYLKAAKILENAGF